MAGNRFGTEKRNQLIFEKIDRKETTYAVLAKELGISTCRVNQIFLREKSKREQEDYPLVPLDAQCRGVIRRAMKAISFTLADLKRFVDENPDWEERLFFTRGCGEHKLGQIKSFMRENGIIR